MNTFTKLAMVAASASLLAACSQEAPAPAQPEEKAPAQVTELAGQAFAWTAAPKKAEKEPTILFLNEGRVAGNSGCNNMMGGFTQDGSKLTFTQLAGTMMACSPDSMEVEKAFLANLGKVASLEMTQDGGIKLLDAQGQEVMTLTKTAMPADAMPVAEKTEEAKK